MSWAYEDDDHTLLSDEFCARQREQALDNFDLNMAFFAHIPPADFENSLHEIVRKNKGLRPVSDLRALDGEEGVYVMVLDEYRQAYIGQSVDMRTRIKKHWTGTKSFDRLLWGNPDESVLSIDSFRSLDTTRIFAARTSRRDQLEARVVKMFPADYTVNRIGGGKPDGIRVMFLEAELKRRKLVRPDVTALPDIA
ncbi:GIY-YIG nuclease family protein [Cryobacterium algoricola]|uniref:GIY-YIG nuclease family protein n=1 Tax=Cryobacterium algoricola TaxID=1259183 RepID=A0ABY2IEA8_9MICO|nr:GIY-YIG nuclease family protein [Cryobacterium algoricola]TFB86878.1 GIY-YIG nuclease family protein [Cryobacterium algoricola]